MTLVAGVEASCRSLDPPCCKTLIPNAEGTRSSKKFRPFFVQQHENMQILQHSGKSSCSESPSTRYKKFFRRLRPFIRQCIVCQCVDADLKPKPLSAADLASAQQKGHNRDKAQNSDDIDSVHHISPTCFHRIAEIVQNRADKDAVHDLPETRFRNVFMPVPRVTADFRRQSRRIGTRNPAQ